MSHDCGRCSNDNGKLRQKWVGVTVCRRFSNKLVIGKRICNICNIGRKLQHNFIYLVSYCTYEWKLLYIQHAISISVTNCIYCFLDKKVHFLV
jgi:hypothetical protein